MKKKITKFKILCLYFSNLPTNFTLFKRGLLYWKWTFCSIFKM